MSGNASKLAAITRELSNQWQQTKEYWRDAKSQEFERQYIQELFAGVDKAVAVIEELDKLATKIRNDCE
jgi:hypothetical protein